MVWDQLSGLWCTRLACTALQPPLIEAAHAGRVRHGGAGQGRRTLRIVGAAHRLDNPGLDRLR
jgi:hypothetical protein